MLQWRNRRIFKVQSSSFSSWMLSPVKKVFHLFRDFVGNYLPRIVAWLWIFLTSGSTPTLSCAWRFGLFYQERWELVDQVFSLSTVFLNVFGCSQYAGKYGHVEHENTPSRVSINETVHNVVVAVCIDTLGAWERKDVSNPGSISWSVWSIELYCSVHAYPSALISPSHHTFSYHPGGPVGFVASHPVTRCSRWATEITGCSRSEGGRSSSYARLLTLCLILNGPINIGDSFDEPGKR